MTWYDENFPPLFLLLHFCNVLLRITFIWIEIDNICVDFMSTICCYDDPSLRWTSFRFLILDSCSHTDSLFPIEIIELLMVGSSLESEKQYHSSFWLSTMSFGFDYIKKGSET